jgi:hypothetical protein
LQNRDRKIETAREQKRHRETEGCTFEPTVINAASRPPIGRRQALQQKQNITYY